MLIEIFHGIMLIGSVTLASYGLYKLLTRCKRCKSFQQGLGERKMAKDLKGLLEQLEKADPDSYQDLTDIIGRHIENAEKLNMILDAIPKLIAQRTGEDEGDAKNITPDILSCDTPDEVCDVINKWMVKNGKR